jgi:ABC-type branched-subunit amino acid transport system substrate-binding protein
LNVTEAQIFRWHRLVVVAVIVILISAGCTTVDRTGLAVGGYAGSGASAGTAGTLGQGPTATGTAAGTNSGGGFGPAGSAAAGSGPSGSSSITGGGISASAGSKSTCAHPVKIGISYSSDESSGLSAVGNPGAAAQDANAVQQQQAAYQLIANNVNSTGGVGGCQVQLVYHDFKALGSDGFSGESQTECTDFAQDQKVFAAIPTVLENKTIITCLAQAHVVDFYDSTGGTYQPNPQDFTNYRGYLYQPGSMSSYRFGSFIHDLANVGYFGSGVKVGILLADDGSGNNQYLVNNLWSPQLSAMGLTPTVFTYRAIEGYSDVADTASAFQSAVLQFRGAGVNRVIFTPDGGDGAIFFTQTASSESYSPLYGLNSDSGPEAWSTVPASERPNAVDMSWQISDLGLNATSQQVAAAGASAARDRCGSILNGHTGSTSPIAFYNVCDALLLMQAALRGVSAVTPSALLAGVDGLGSSFSVAGGYGNASFGPPDRYDGASAIRAMKWNESAQQWQFVTGPLSVPAAG